MMEEGSDDEGQKEEPPALADGDLSGSGHGGQFSPPSAALRQSPQIRTLKSSLRS